MAKLAMGLKIERRQMERVADDWLARRIIATLGERYPTEIDAEDPLVLYETVRGQIDAARQYGLISSYSVATFVATAWVLGIGFDKKIPAVAECLTREDMSEEEKALWLEQFTVLLFSTLAED